MKYESEIQTVVDLSKWTGFWWHFDNKKVKELINSILQYTRLLFMFSVWTLSAFGAYNVGIKSSIADGSAAFISAGFAANIHTTILLMYRKKYMILINMLNAMIKSHEEWESKVCREEVTFIKLISKTYGKTLFGFWFFYNPFLFTLDCILVSAFGYSGPPLSSKSPQILNYYTPTQRNMEYYVLTFISYTYQLLGFSINYGYETGSWLLMGYTQREIRIIIKKLKMIEEFYGNKDLMRTYKFYDVIACHVQVIKLKNQLKEVYGMPYAFQNVFFSIVICLSAYGFCHEQNIIVRILDVYSVAGLLGITFTSCFFGQRLIDESDKLLQALYEIPWINLKLSYQKDINMMIRQAKNPLIIDYRGNGAISLPSFLNVWNASYSYFTLLRTTVS